MAEAYGDMTVSGIDLASFFRSHQPPLSPIGTNQGFHSERKTIGPRKTDEAILLDSFDQNEVEKSNNYMIRSAIVFPLSHSQKMTVNPIREEKIRSQNDKK